MKFSNQFNSLFNYCRQSNINLKCNTFAVRTCALVFSLISVSILFLMFYMSSMSENEPTTPENKSLFRSIHDFIDAQTDFDYSGCTSYECTFTCTNSITLNENLNIILEENNCTSIDSLHIERQNFINGSLTKNWLLTNYCLHELVIMNSDIEMIENEAFNTEIFTETFILSLQNLQIEKLTAGILLGLSQLEYLTVISRVNEINRGFFQPVRASLHFLKLNLMTNAIQFDDIFGISNMTSLTHLDLSLNNFNQAITGAVFQFLPILRYLNLSKSKITVIAENAFEHIKDSLRFLDLSHNRLKNIIDLKDILIDRTIYVYLRENQWACDCNLAAFVKTFTEYKDLFLDVPYCKSPHKYYGEIINSIAYNCPHNENNFTDPDPHPTPKDSSTITASTIQLDDGYSSADGSHAYEKTVVPPNLADKPFFQLSCSEPSTFENFLPANEQRNLPTEKTYDRIKIAPPFYEFYIELIGNNSVNITVQNFIEDLSVLWYYNDPEDYELLNLKTHNQTYGCMFQQQNKTIFIENLKTNFSYTFCLIPEGNITITPFNCLPFHIPAIDNVPKSVVWISNNNKNLTVAMVCLVLSLAMTFGGGLAYIIIKNNPDLLEGNKHVLVVKKSLDEKSSPLPTISGASSMKNRVSLIPLTSTEITMETDSAYETPVDMEFDDLDYVIGRQYRTESESMQDYPPPLPYDNDMVDHIYGQIGSPVVHHKRSI